MTAKAAASEILEVNGALDGLARAADRSAATDAGLWSLTLVLGALMVLWTLFGGGGAEAAGARAGAMARLWPLAAAWCAGLAIHSRGTASMRRELIRVEGITRLAGRATTT